MEATEDWKRNDLAFISQAGLGRDDCRDALPKTLVRTSRIQVRLVQPLLLYGYAV